MFVIFIKGVLKMDGLKSGERAVVKTKKTTDP